MKIVSLFSGIGGFEQGILQADPTAEFVFASEIDKYARSIYRKHFGVDPSGDITKINAAGVPRHDILVSGPPCQDYSIAGKRAGLCGEKGSMFYEIFRIVREKNPRFVLIENVKGILSSNAGWDFARILVELEISGYECEWQICDTAAFLPQRRERVFIIGHLRTGRGCGRKIFPIEKSGGLDNEEEPTVYTIDANYFKGPAQQSRTMILCDSGPGRSNQIRDEIIAPVRANTGAGHNNVVCHSTFPRNSLSRLGGTGHLQRDDGLSYCCDAGNNIAVEVPRIAKCQTGGGHSGGNHSDMTVLKTNNRLRRLTPKEVEKLQGFPIGWTAEGIDDNGNIVKISDTQRYKMLGNAVTTTVIEYLFKHIMNVM